MSVDESMKARYRDSHSSGTPSMSIRAITSDVHPITPAPPLSFRDRLLDQMTVLMLHADSLLSMLDVEEANNFLWLEPHIRKVYDDVNSAMKRVTD
jgi:hypothetical protein